MTETAPARKRVVLRACGAAAILLLAVVWTANAWSPSSYAIVLRSLEARDTGPAFGTPRGVRSDEWSIATPLVQATVNNGFHRYNETSFYREDLRTVAALPLFDWGLVFK